MFCERSIGMMINHYYQGNNARAKRTEVDANFNKTKT